MRKANVKEVSERLKGTPGTTLKLKIKRPGEKSERTLTIFREKIEMDPVTYAGVMNDSIGYFHFGSFTTKSSERVKETVNDLKNKGGQIAYHGSPRKRGWHT